MPAEDLVLQGARPQQACYWPDLRGIFQATSGDSITNAGVGEKKMNKSENNETNKLTLP